MTPLPSDLLTSLPPGSEPVAKAWWETLSGDDRQRIAQLWDERLEVRFFTPQEDEHGCSDTWETVPQVKGGRFVPSDDDGRGDWQPGYFEHLLQHPELVLAVDPTNHRIFYICTQHAIARQCQQNGAVPADFQCPFQHGQCYLHPLRGARLVRR